MGLITTVYAEGLIPCSGSACTMSDLYQLGYNIINFGLDFAALIAVVVLLWGGILILTAGGSEARVSKGRSAITAAVVGLMIVLGSWIMINTFISVFTTCSGWNVFGGIKC
ncbi:MAG: hypothetical protein V1652_04100 [bacterium]